MKNVSDRLYQVLPSSGYSVVPSTRILRTIDVSQPAQPMVIGEASLATTEWPHTYDQYRIDVA